MSNSKYFNAEGTLEYRKSDGDGTDVDPKILYNKVEGVATEVKQDNLNADVALIKAHVDLVETKLDALGALLTTIDGKLTAANTGAVTVSAALPAGNNNIGDVDIASALPAGTNAIGKLAANSGVDIGDVDVVALTGSTIAHDGADSGNPHKIGMKATASLAGITPVAAGDRSDLYCGLDGVPIVREGCNLEDGISDVLTNTDGASTPFTGDMAAPGANIRLVVTQAIVSNSSATFTTVDIRDGAAGAVRGHVPAPAGGGASIKFTPPLRLSANTAAAIDAAAATTTLKVTLLGYKTKV